MVMGSAVMSLGSLIRPTLFQEFSPIFPKSFSTEMEYELTDSSISFPDQEVDEQMFDLILLRWTLAEAWGHHKQRKQKQCTIWRNWRVTAINEGNFFSKDLQRHAYIQKYDNVQTCKRVSKAIKTGWKTSAKRPYPIKGQLALVRENPIANRVFLKIAL